MKLNKKITLAVLVVLVFSMLLSACGNNDAGSSSDANTSKPAPTNGEYNERDADYIIRYASTMGANELESLNPGGQGLNAFKKYVEDTTDGKVFIKFFLGGQLASSNEEMVNGIRSGAFDMMNLHTGSWSEFSNAFLPLNAPYLFITPEAGYRTLLGDLGQRMNGDLLEDTGIRNLAYLNLGNRQLTNSIRPVKSPDDIQGLKIRTMSDPYQIATWDALGASVTPTAYAELYTALQQGMVDGQENPLSNLHSSGMYEIQDYLTLTNHSATFTTIVIYDEVLQSLPEEYQNVLIEGAAHAAEIANEVLAVSEEEIMDDISNYLEIYEPSIDELMEFRDATEIIREEMLREEIGDEYYNFILEEIDKVEKELGYN